MTIRITFAELTEHLPDVLERVRQNGESFVVEGDGVPLATIAPPPVAKARSWRELVEQLAELPRPVDKFADDLEEARAIMNRIPAEPPEWPS